MGLHYSVEKNVALLVSLLKAHNIRKVVASPGTTNVTFVGSLMNDPFFEIYSSVDERSAAYIACGLATESGEPVVITCTGATASRNYYPGLTEAFYRKLPILAVTGTRDESMVGHLIDQQLDRNVQPKDTVLVSEHLQTIKDETDLWNCTVKANRAILALTHRGGGPAHINLTTCYTRNFSLKELPKIQKISRYTYFDTLPNLDAKKVAIYIGTHVKWTKEQTAEVDAFCETYNAVVFYDLCGNYKGKYGICYPLVLQQRILDDNKNIDLLIHIGEVSNFQMHFNPKRVWRVSEDGELRDTFRKLEAVFEMPEIEFFRHYADSTSKQEMTYYKSCVDAYNRVYAKIPEMPLSNLWLAYYLHDKLPHNIILHLGIVSTVRAWNFFHVDSSIDINCNQGGFGIDGNMSTLLGAALARPDKMCVGIVGDLSFFYDLNVLGNRHVPNNFRIILINNGRGNEFRLPGNIGSTFGEDTDKYIAAAGHFGNKSPYVVKHFAEDLGFDYITASYKEEFISLLPKFFVNHSEKPIIYEVFTDMSDEIEGLTNIGDVEINPLIQCKYKIKGIIGEDAVNVAKKVKKLLK